MQRHRGTRIPALDGLRGVLAVVVLAHHVALFLGTNALALAGEGSVWIFFAMSGHVLTRSWDGRYLPFLARRAVRLWPVYAVCIAAGYAVVGREPVWSEFVWHPWMGHTFDRLWRPPVLPDLWQIPDTPVWSLYREAWAMPFMPAMAWFGFRPHVRAWLIIPVWVVLLRVNAQYFFYSIFFFTGAALSGWTPRCRLLEARVPQWLGTVSYSLYLSNWIVLSFWTHVAGRAGVALALPLALPVAWLLWWAVERPSIQLSRRVGAWWPKGRRNLAAPQRLWVNFID